MKAHRFDINRFPYPIAQVEGYLPKSERGLDMAGGVVGSIQMAVICFETICRFCVWEMVMEYARLGVTQPKLKDALDHFIFIAGGSLGTGKGVELWRDLSSHLRYQQQTLFMPEMPFVFFDQTKGDLTAVAKDAINPFPQHRNKEYGHLSTCKSPESQIGFYMSMRDKLYNILSALSFLEDYCLISVRKVENNVVKEAYLLEGHGPDVEFDICEADISLGSAQEIRNNMTLLIKREAIDGSSNDNPFLLYPVFLFDAFQYKNPDKIANRKSHVPDDLYVLTSIKHNRRSIQNLTFSGHRKDGQSQDIKGDINEPDCVRLLEEFHFLLSRMGFPLDGALHSKASRPSPFDKTQDDEIDRLLRIYLERGEATMDVRQFLGRKKQCLIICGEPGSGKSAFLSRLIRMRKDIHAHSAYHFICSGRRDWKRILCSILYQLKQQFDEDLAYSIQLPNESFDDETILQMYLEGLSRVNRLLDGKDEPLVIFLDALDELAIQGEDATSNKAFQCVPPRAELDNIRFIISSRPGHMYQAFTTYLGLNTPREFTLRRMDRFELKEIAILYEMSLSVEELEKIFCVSLGNPLYLSFILKRMKYEGIHDLSKLPDNILAFFKKELVEKYGIREDDLLRDVLATRMVLKKPPTALDLAEIFGLRSSKEIKNRVLNRIASYLIESGQRTYSFFHLRFEESLFYGSDSILDEEDSIAAHRRVIDWCEPLEQWKEGDPRLDYGFEFLPYHYWELGEKDRRDGFSGFLKLLGRNNLRCEIACRIFLRDMVRKRPLGELLKDETFLIKFEDLFIAGNDAARYGLLRFDGNLSGYGYVEFRKTIWDRIITHFKPGECWFEEILRRTGVLEDTRFDLFMERIQSRESAFCRDHLRAYYYNCGIRLCTVSDAKERFDPILGLEMLSKSRELLEAMSPEELLSSSCNDGQYSQYCLNTRKRTFYNGYAISCRRVGRIDDAINGYQETLRFKDELVSTEKNSFCREQVQDSIGTTQHNLAYILAMRGEYAKAADLFMQALLVRAKNREKTAVILTLKLLDDLFEDTRLDQLSQYIKYFIFGVRNPQTAKGRKINCGTLLSYLLQNSNSDLGKAQETLEEMVSLRGQEKQSHLGHFHTKKDYLKLALAQRRGEDALCHLKHAMDIFKTHGEQKTHDICGRAFMNFWEIAARTHLLNDQFPEIKIVLFERLEPWISQHGFNAFLPRLQELQAEYHFKTGNHAQAETCRAKVAQQIYKARLSIADKRFPEELLQYMSYLIENSGNQELANMHSGILDRLKNGFAPEYLTSEAPLTIA